MAEAQVESVSSDVVAAAKDAGLRYVSDTQPGIRRRRAGRGFKYSASDGGAIRDKAELDRIAKIVIPPAWTDVWICPHSRGHIQATGRDARGRKQYRYHPDWHATRDANKYDRMLAFAETLPKIRRRTKQDLRKPGLPREKVVATVINLLEKSLIRVGNDEYAKANNSYGLTTLRNKHVRVRGAMLKFEFQGKSGKRHTVDVEDKRLARIVKACQDLPGQQLFEYLDESGERRNVASNDVNAYLKELTGQDFTAKDFRTWAGTVLACDALSGLAAFESQAAAKKNVVEAIAAVAQQLGNTKAVCRKAYIHPLIIECYLAGALAAKSSQASANGKPRRGLSTREASVLALVRRLAKGAKRKGS